MNVVVYSDVVCIENKRVILYRLPHSTKPTCMPLINNTPKYHSHTIFFHFGFKFRVENEFIGTWNQLTKVPDQKTKAKSAIKSAFQWCNQTFPKFAYVSHIKNLPIAGKFFLLLTHIFPIIFLTVLCPSMSFQICVCLNHHIHVHA